MIRYKRKAMGGEGRHRLCVPSGSRSKAPDRTEADPVPPNEVHDSRLRPPRESLL